MNDKIDQVKIKTYRKDGGSRTYSNYVRVTASPFEVTLQYSDVKPGANDEDHEKIKKDKKVTALIDVEIVMPIDIAKGFSEVLQKQLKIVEINSKKLKK